MLIAAAHNRQTMTYSEIGGLVGLASLGVGRYLYLIKDYCEDHGLPPLTVLVVRKDSGEPGSGMGLDDPVPAQEQVFAHPWYSLTPLAAADLAPYAGRKD